MKYQFMRDHVQLFSVKRMSCVFKVSRSGYYHFTRCKPSARQLENRRLLEEIKLIHDDNRQVYGSPRIHAALSLQGEVCSRKRVAKLMRKEGLQAKMKRRFKITTQVDLQAKKAPNLLQQHFVSEKPNHRWVADITYVATAEGGGYFRLIFSTYCRSCHE